LAADGEVPSTDGHDVVEVEFPGFGASLAGELVEAFDVDAAFGHQQLTARCATAVGPPRLDHRGSCRGGVVE
jgi:hypothetical protein